ncbi:MAG: hypothetical protein M1816_006713 [Peltula sp. TS41687]|nr:MAG: hypothetical protein M1816_006713 [Peltula sp. TS41687]
MVDFQNSSQPYLMTRVCPVDMGYLKREYSKVIGASAAPSVQLLDQFWEVVRFYSEKCDHYLKYKQDLLKDHGLLRLDFDSLQTESKHLDNMVEGFEKDVEELEKKVEDLEKALEEKRKQVASLKDELRLQALAKTNSISGTVPSRYERSLDLGIYKFTEASMVSPIASSISQTEANCKVYRAPGRDTDKIDVPTTGEQVSKSGSNSLMVHYQRTPPEQYSQCPRVPSTSSNVALPLG